MGRAQVVEALSKRYKLFLSDARWPLGVQKLRLNGSWHEPISLVNDAMKVARDCCKRAIVADSVTGRVIFRTDVPGYPDVLDEEYLRRTNPRSKLYDPHA